MKQQSVAGKYEYLTHPADLKIRAQGTTLEEALCNLVSAMSAIRDDATAPSGSTSQNVSSQRVSISLDARRLTSLVFDLCQRYLEILETQRLVPCTMTDAVISQTRRGYTMQAQLICYPAQDQSNSIKAPTYHEMNIESRGDRTFVTVVLDI